MIIGLRTTGALVCLLLAQIGLIFCQTSATQDRVAGWRSDLDFLLSEMRRQHYIYRSQPLPEALERRAAELRQAVPRFGDERMLAEFQRLMSFLGDGHCYIMPAGAERVRSTYLPLRFYLFSDGLYVIDADAGHDRHTRAVFVGEPSSSKPNFVGEENQIALPWSGAIGSISNRYHESIPGDTRVWIEPEIKVELSSKDYFANRDPVLEAVLKRYQK